VEANWRRMTVVEFRDLRQAGGLMLVAAAILPQIPGHPGAPCPLRALTGVPCPLCGMTTSVEDTVGGHLGSAVCANPAGVLAVVAAVALLLFRPRQVRFPAAVPIAVLVAMWLFELHRFSYL
jgi:hypothetical protein